MEPDYFSNLGFMPLLAHYIHSVKMITKVQDAHQKAGSSSPTKSKTAPLLLVDKEQATSGKVHVVKVCSLFKPLLRRFRSFFRTKFDQGRKISLYQHWKPETFVLHTKKFMKSLGVPDALMDEASMLKILTIIFPCTIKKVKPNQYVRERTLLIQIFRENCNVKR